jgi:protease-4
MKNLLKKIIAIFLAALGAVVRILLIIILLAGVAWGLYRCYSLVYKPTSPKLAPNTVLTISLEGQLEEKVLRYLLPFRNKKAKQAIDLLVIKKVLAQAQMDDRIAGLYLKIGNLSAGWVLLDELRSALQDFKSSKKFIVTYAEDYVPKTYYLASLADEIFLHPEGSFEFKGLSLTVSFYKGLFDKLQISPEIFRVGRYKSAVEPFTGYNMSEASKEQASVLLSRIYHQFIQAISTARSIPSSTLQNIAHTLAVAHPQEAKEAGFITQLGYVSDLEDAIKHKLSLTTEQKISYIDYDSYYPVLTNKEDANRTQDKIAVIMATGDMVNSPRTSRKEIFAGKLVKILSRLRKDATVKAIVIRINSPGGSSLAATTLWKELTLAKAAKPVVASLADLAASGGYYLAIASNYIVAHPLTLTGSIGVFAIYFDIHQALKDKLGISFDSVKTSPSADMFSLSRPFTEQERKVLQKNVERSYASFVEHVAASRHKTADEIHALAQGRIWTGTLAKEHGLVDELGDLDNAIQKAASLAGLKEYKVVYISQYKSNVIKELMARNPWQFFPFNQTVLDSYYKQLDVLCQLQNVQAKYPYTIEIQ